MSAFQLRQFELLHCSQLGGNQREPTVQREIAASFEERMMPGSTRSQGPRSDQNLRSEACFRFRVFDLDAVDACTYKAFRSHRRLLEQRALRISRWALGSLRPAHGTCAPLTDDHGRTRRMLMLTRALLDNVPSRTTPSRCFLTDDLPHPNPSCSCSAAVPLPLSSLSLERQ